MSASPSMMDDPYGTLQHPTDREIVVHGGRVKYIHNVDKDDHNNRVITSQYTWWNFLPKNIFIQFCNGANLYFLIIGILQCIPATSTSKGIPTMYVPLFFVICVGAIRAAIEDRARHISDSERNNTKLWRLGGSLDYGKTVPVELHDDEDWVETQADIPYRNIPWVDCGNRVRSIERISLLPGEDGTPYVYKEDNWLSRLLSNNNSKNEITEEEEHVERRRATLLEENKKLCVVNSGDLKVGSIVKVYKNQMVPCDMILLGTSETRGHCFIDKANLNGETTLEVVSSPPVFRPYIDASGAQLYQLSLHAVYECPSSNFERFRCDMEVQVKGKDSFALNITAKQLLLRETVLRNSEWVFGLCVYTGDDTKIRRSISTDSSGGAPVKVTRILRLVNQLVAAMFAMQIVLCIIGGAYSAYWRFTQGHKHDYLLQADHNTKTIILDSFYAAFSWMILMSTIVPISLIVSSEMCKFAISWFIEWDLSMYSDVIKKGAVCNTSAVHEDLGMIDYVFSDKTGTLTQNKMEFRYGFIGIVEKELEGPQPSNCDVNTFSSFGSIDTDIARAVKEKLAISSNRSTEKNVMYPSTNVMAYTDLPRRWTEQIRNDVIPIRNSSARVSPAELKKSANPALATKVARLKQLRGGFVGNGVFSLMWNQCQGAYFNMYMHAKKEFLKYRLSGSYDNYLIELAEKKEAPRSEVHKGSNEYNRGGSAVYHKYSDLQSSMSNLQRGFDAMAEPEAAVQPGLVAYDARGDLDDDMRVNPDFLGSFGSDERLRMLNVLWEGNWKDHDSIASIEERRAILRYLRNMALSGTVKPYRKSNNDLDWQFESAEELAMVRFAAACGFVRDNHPSGMGTVLYVREYTTPELVLEHSRIHVECYYSIATLGFNSKRARVSVLWQRQPFQVVTSFPMKAETRTGDVMTMPIETDYTLKVRSCYLMEYDQERLDRMNTPNMPEAGYLHMMTKGQDSVLLPLLQQSSTASQVPHQDVDFKVPLTDTHHPLQTELREMSSNGLRVLVAGYSDLPSNWWSTYQEAYDAMNHLEDEQIVREKPLLASNLDLSPVSSKAGSPRQKQPSVSSSGALGSNIIALTKLPVLAELLAGMSIAETVNVAMLRHELYSRIEHDCKLSLLGCIAMEDKLQPLVPETVRDLSRGGVRVWMITGDKLDTARNIALACELIDADMVMSQQQIDITTKIIDANLTLPLAVRASRGKRLVEVTGEWHASSSADLALVFELLDESHEGAITLGLLQRCLVALGVEVTLSQLFLAISGSPQIPPHKVVPDYRVTKQQFVDNLFELQQQLTISDAVFIDIEQGIATYKTTSQSLPLSLLVNRDAFLILFPPQAKVSQASSALNSGVNSPTVLSPRNEEANITSGTTLTYNPNLTELLNKRFFALSTLCKSVIFARAEPAMKKRMVTSIQQQFPHAVTLAIGDGANDTEMISAASIGVGLCGVEGTAASNISDYSITSFRMLHTLLLAHGTKAYCCVSKLIVLMFYKASLLAWVNYMFGLDSCFTGQQYFNDALYQLYNIVYTAWPVLIIGSLDLPLPVAVLENSPAVFRSTKGTMFTRSLFAKWMLRSLFHAAYVYYVPWLALKQDGADIMGTGHGGKTIDFWYLSTLQLAVLSVLPNMISLLIMDNVTIFHWIAVIGSSFSYFLMLGLLTISGSFNPDVYTYAQVLLTDIRFYLMFSLLISVPLIVDIIIRSLYAAFWPTLTQVLRERIILRYKEYWRLARLQGINPRQESLSKRRTSGKQAANNTVKEPLLMSPVAVGNDNDYGASEEHALPANVTPCWSVQVMGPDPDSCALDSCDLFGEAAGWGVRATQTETLMVEKRTGDRFNKLTTEAQKVLDGCHIDVIDYVQDTQGVLAQWRGVMSRLTAGRILRALVILKHNNVDSGYHSAASQKHAKNEQYKK